MRIRKNAFRILGSSSSPPASAAAAAATALLPPPTKPARELLQKCELNQSPWDVMSFPLPPSSPQKLGNDGLEKDMSVKTRRTNRKRAVSRKSIVIKEEATDHNEAREARADSGSSTVPTCKKMDGKKWKCKRAAKQPHTLCEYHLTQLKSYSRVDDVPPPRDIRPRSKKRQKVAAAGSDSGYYYYYSGFGPWRGKKRGGGGSASGSGDMNGAVKEEAQEDSDKEEEEPVRVQEDVDDDDEDSLDEHNEEEEAMQQQQQQISNPRRRRRRKARSIKSLL